ncbi:MAG: STAS domain-containing protein [bacterium]|nr:STAS domain-containing protein [bacterium]MBK7670788.1 STAS domain-containing protein [bacterium]
MIRQNDKAVWVTLSGILDRAGMEKLIAGVAPKLNRRGVRIVLDGSRLSHLDYRATGALVAWNRRLRLFNHQLYLHGWSDYLKAIVVMEDWDRELGATPTAMTAWHQPAGAHSDVMP